ncbi:MAG TPA: hypothetical protein PK941_12720 [Paludibacter sp.]|nr:hypothetical protein [Paludibacter sp.]
MIDRQIQMDEIYDFVKRHKFSHASRAVCSRIVGEGFMGIDQDVLDDLKEKLPEIPEDELEACYYIIK